MISIFHLWRLQIWLRNRREANLRPCRTGWIESETGRRRQMTFFEFLSSLGVGFLQMSHRTEMTSKCRKPEWYRRCRASSGRLRTLTDVSQRKLSPPSKGVTSITSTRRQIVREIDPQTVFINSSTNVTSKFRRSLAMQTNSRRRQTKSSSSQGRAGRGAKGAVSQTIRTSPEGGCRSGISIDERVLVAFEFSRTDGPEEKLRKSGEIA